MLLNNYFKIASFEYESVVNASVLESLSSRRFAQKSGAQRWRLRLTSNQMPSEKWMVLGAQIDSLEGPMGTFSVKLGVNQVNADVSDGFVIGGISAGSSVIQMQNHAVLLPGSFVKFSGHSKVYKIVQSTNSSLQIYPELMTDLVDGEVIVFDDPAFTVSIESRVNPFAIAGAMWSQAYDLTVIEEI